MTVNFEETISQERLKQGKLLQKKLNRLERENKNAIIGFRIVNKDVPEHLDNEDLQWVDFKSSIDTLASMGVCEVNEEDLQELLADFKKEVGEIYRDHKAWSILTVLEVDDYKKTDESYYEANVHEEGSKVNSVPIDLLGESEEIELVTCKFNIATQREAAKNKADELYDLSEKLDVDCTVCLGTLNPKIKERIESNVDGKFDEIVSGMDILDFG